MTVRELDPDQLLGALGELHRAERTELARLEQPAQELAALEPERAQALEARLMQELFVAKVALQPPQAATDLQPAAMHPEYPRLDEAQCEKGSRAELRSFVSQQRRPRSARAAQLASAAAVSVAMAAAAMLWIGQPGAQPFAPTYTLEAPSPDAVSRSPATQATAGVYSLGRTLTFALRPALRYDGAIRVACFAVQENTVIHLEPQVELDPAGGARVTLSAGTLTRALHEGRWQLRFYVSPPSATAVSASQVRARQCPSDTRCLALDVRFVEPERQ
jgi:hypothetical protein